MEKRRKIFDDGATVVEEVISKPKKKPELSIDVNKSINNRNIGKKTVTVEDVIDTLAGYLPTQVNFMPKDGGECLICGKETSSSMRKICFTCLQNKGEILYKNTKKAIENGNKEFQV